MRNLPWLQELGLSGARFNRAIICYTARQDHCIKEILTPSIVKLDIPTFISFRLPEGDMYRNKPHAIKALKDIWLQIAKTGRDALKQKTGNLQRRGSDV